MSTPYKHFLIWILVLLSTTAFAAQPDVISVPRPYDNIGKSLTILKDPTNSFTTEEVIGMDKAGKFAPSTESILNLGNSSSAFWIKIRYSNPGEEKAYLIVDVPNIEHIDLYSTDSQGKLISKSTGSMSPSHPGVIATNHYIFDLERTNGQHKDIYLKVKSNNLMLVALKIADAQTLVSSGNLKLGFQAVYSGILIMLFIFNIFLFTTVKDRTYLYYSIYIASLFVYVVLYIRGYGYIFGDNFRSFVNLYPHTFASLATIAAFLFSWEFLGIKSRVPKLVPIYKGMIGVWIIVFIIALFGGKTYLSLIVNYLSLISCIIAWYAGLQAYRQGLKSALYYLIAWIAVGISFFIALLGLTGVIPYYDISYEMGPVGTTIEMLLLAFALTDRVNSISLEKKRFEKENLELVMSQNERLEIVVEERTRRLSKVNSDKDKLFSIVAHDLRSPFNSLVSILELNDNDMLTFEELKSLLQETRKNVDQINLTLNNLLYWAKGQMEMPGSNPRQLDLKLKIETLLLVYEPLSVSKKIKLSASVVGDCSVYADANEINLILRNLIDNAIKFSLPDTEILVKMERQLEQVMVSVSNETQEHNTRKLKALVNPEESYVSSLGENQQGIGLGLQLCREYIKQNGGEMHFDIGDGQITISFRLPTFVE